MIDWINICNTPSAQQKEDRHFAKRAVERMTNHFLSTKNVLPCALLSGGKDSTSMTSVSLVAWANAIKANPALAKVPFLIAYSDTRVESPLKAGYFSILKKQFSDFAERENITLKIIEATPPLTASWQGKVVGGCIRAWDVRLGKNGCASDWKVSPIKKALAPYQKTAKRTGFKLVKLLGVRKGESLVRDNRLKNMSIDGIAQETETESILYPILDWSLSNVWDYLLLCEDIAQNEDSLMPAVSDGFHATVKFYNSMSATECSALEGKSACSSSRDGCYICAASPSMELDQDIATKNPHIAPLFEFRRFLIANNTNVYNRSYLQPKPSAIGEYKATSHSGAYLLDILRIGLTIQIREQERAEHARNLAENNLNIGSDLTTPQFTIFTAKEIAFIDYNWMQRGLQIEAFAALKAYIDVYFNHQRFDIPSGYRRTTMFDDNPKADSGTVVYDNFQQDDPTTQCHDVDFDDITTDKWEFADDDSFDALFSDPELLKTITQEKDHIAASMFWVKTGLFHPPKSQINKIKKRSAWARAVIYRNNLHHFSFHGGPFLREK